MGGARVARLLAGLVVGVVLAVSVTITGCGGAQEAASGGGETMPGPSGPPGAGGASPRGATGDPVIVAAGDIACASCAQAQTAELVTNLAQAQPLAAILTMGDQAYPRGALDDYQRWYAPGWGRADLRAITHPVLGGHDYLASPGDGSGYFDYFYGPGVASGPFGARGQGYYSFDVGAWHLVALNTSIGCGRVACDEGSAQVAWLAGDLAAHPAACTLAYFHEPRFQNGATHGDAASAATLWDTLLAGGADVVLNGHEHNYQQLGPMDADGHADPARGMRTFVVGTGGTGLYTKFGSAHADVVEARDAQDHGVLELTLHATSFDWRFIAVGGAVVASGSATCH